MRKVIGLGETILDILFRHKQPTAAVPGGSSFNSIISIGRAGIPAIFVGETGNDEVGQQIADFLKENHVDASYLRRLDQIKSSISLAFLDDNNDAHYTFYKSQPCTNLDVTYPQVNADDIIQFGSYYAISPSTHQQVKAFLTKAKAQNAILFYDLNFRRPHLKELEQLWPAIHDNFRLSNVVRGSADDFEVMYNERDPETIYKKHIINYCPLFICTQGSEGITLCTPNGCQHYAVTPVQTVSNIGAGDNFNAGFIYGLYREGIRHQDLEELSSTEWEKLIRYGESFAANVCASIHNSIDVTFGRQMTIQPE